ncbi:uncharacterized protein LOC142748583 isoform X2 [Rhinoderma darwinii]|uniref:uncharacterized protein LOC142748583 isoform X2 n=1 Tax=Rhinoderma darwinii TaxID=43563 RepID=UPI003F67F7B8
MPTLLQYLTKERWTLDRAVTRQLRILLTPYYLRGPGRSIWPPGNPGYSSKNLLAKEIMEKKDVTKQFIMQQMLTSWRNKEMEDNVETESNGDYSELLTPEMLGSVLYATKKVCFDNNESRLFCAAFTLAFYGPFDMEELVARNKDEDGTGLAFKEVIMERNSVYCKMQKVRSNKSQWVEVKKRDDKFLCPVNRIKKFLEVRPEGGRNFFIHENGTPLTQFQFSRVLSFALEEAGLDSRRFGPHSLIYKT